MDYDVAIQVLTEQIAELQARLSSYEAHGLNALTYGQLADHPVRYSTTVPTTTAMTADGQIRVIRTGGLDYLYVRSAGAIRRVQVA